MVAFVGSPEAIGESRGISRFARKADRSQRSRGFVSLSLAEKIRRL